MFDTKVFHTTNESVPYAKTVTINKAPTDESIKLYEEFKRRAYDSIIDAFEVSENAFNFKAFIYRDYNQYITYFRYAGSINGKKLRGESRVEIEKYDREVILRKIYKDVAEQLAKQIICSDSVIRDISKASL